MKNAIVFFVLFLAFCTSVISQNYSTAFSDSHTIVLQVLPELQTAEKTVNRKSAARIVAAVFIPKDTNSLFHIASRLKYFQEKASLKQKWIMNNKGQKIPLGAVDKVTRVIITKKKNSKEELIKLTPQFEKGLLKYFKRDVYHNLRENKGFDCFAFACLVSNVKHDKAAPDFFYSKNQPNVGDVVVFAESPNVTSIAVKHWAIYMGDDVYLSKFGMTGYGVLLFLFSPPYPV